MDQELAYEFIEEANKRELMEILDAVINRFRELYTDQELMVMTLSVGDPVTRRKQLERTIELMAKYEREREEDLRIPSQQY